MSSRNFYALLSVVLACILCWQTTHGARDPQDPNKDELLELYGLFADAVEQVESNYVRPVSRRELLEHALQGMLQSLDQHSAYFSPEDWARFRKTYEGSYSGIGIQTEIDPVSKRLKVLAPLIDTPAYDAGILAGDLILEVDGQSTEGITQDRATELLQGRPGTSVKLQVLHQGSDKAMNYEITRKLIETESVLGFKRKADNAWDFLIDPERKIGYVRITSFYQTTADDVRKALDQLKSQGLAALILDLRTDPGGLLSAAVEVSDLFVEGGTIVSTKGRNTRERRFEAQKDGTYSGFPMAVLVNRHSASAAEIVAACLQDSGRAVVVGERSYGKGSVQNILELEDGASFLKLTVETYFRPSGKNIHKFPDAKDSDEWGVSPSEGLSLPLSDEDYFAWSQARRERDQNARIALPRTNADDTLPPDRQLDLAVDALKKALDQASKPADEVKKAA